MHFRCVSHQNKSIGRKPDSNREMIDLSGLVWIISSILCELIINPHDPTPWSESFRVSEMFRNGSITDTFWTIIFSCPWIESVSLQRYSKFVRGNRSKLCKIRKIDKTDICCREVSRVAKIYQKVIVLERIAICIEKVARDTKKVAVATF